MKNEGFIVGYGVVGQATAKALGITKYFDLKGSPWTLEDARKYKYIFICVPTPTVNGRCDTSAVEATVKQLGGNHVFVIRSTVTPGTCRNLANKYHVMTVSYPEFLTMSTAEEDALNPDLVVIGSDHKPALDGLSNYFLTDFPKDGSKGVPYLVRTDSTTAEMIKYAINTFYATKVVFANALYDVCQSAGVDYDTVKRAMYKRKWVGDNHLTVPFNGKRGLGGPCLPKDLEAFASYSSKLFFRKMHQMAEEKCW